MNERIFSLVFLAIGVPQPIWGMPAKFGGLGQLVKGEIETAQTVHKGLAKLLYRFPR
jgi:hypothetical protein